MSKFVFQSLKLMRQSLRSTSKSLLPSLLLGFAVLAVSTSARAQQETLLNRQLERLDLGVGGAAVFTKSVSGSNYQNQPVQLDASTTLGALVQVRYTKSPLLGAEFNYSYARFTENFSGMPFGSNSSTVGNFGVQTNVSEYTVGYVAHLPTLLGLQPFAGGGGGTTAFKPTPMGGQNLPERARATFYYDIGVEDQLTRYFGVRAQFRQAFYKAPDFGANYLTINKRTFTSEPTVGFFIKF